MATPKQTEYGNRLSIEKRLEMMAASGALDFVCSAALRRKADTWALASFWKDGQVTARRSAGKGVSPSSSRTLADARLS